MNENSATTELARVTAARVVDLFNWDREEQMAEAFREVLGVIEDGFRRLAENHAAAARRHAQPKPN